MTNDITNSLYQNEVFTAEDIRRLTWQSRRGMLELDVLLVPFVQQAFAELDITDQRRYVKLLACEDQDLFQWFMQRSEPEDPELKVIVDKILARVQPQ